MHSPVIIRLLILINNDIDLDIATLRCSLSQALRLYIYPYFRPVEADPAAPKDAKTKGTAAGSKKGRSPSPKSKQQRRASTITDTTNKKKSTSLQPSEITSDQQSLPEAAEEQRQRPALELQQLNTVIFGLPNLTFAP